MKCANGHAMCANNSPNFDNAPMIARGVWAGPKGGAGLGDVSADDLPCDVRYVRYDAEIDAML